jgi:hypothetical protein
MTEILLKESSSAPLVKSGKRWLVTVATPGQGSSGKYAAEMLKEYGPAALAPGAKAFFDHDAKRSVKDMVGTYPEGAFWNEESQKLQAYLQPFKHWQEVVDEIGPYAEASIYMMGEADEEGNVTKLIPHRTNGADLVGYGGLAGSGLVEQVENLIESARAQISTNPGAASAQGNTEKDDTTIMEEQIKDILVKLAVIEGFVNEQKALASEQAAQTAKTQTVEEALTQYAAAEQAISEAELLPSQVESLRAEAKKGVDVLPLIESAKKIVVEAKSLIESGIPSGRVLTTQVSAPADLIPKGW